LTASIPMRIGPPSCATTALGVAMLAIPAPAMPPTNCRRDIVIGSSRNAGFEHQLFPYLLIEQFIGRKLQMIK
jgi:hypothetical protein